MSRQRAWLASVLCALGWLVRDPPTPRHGERRTASIAGRVTSGQGRAIAHAHVCGYASAWRLTSQQRQHAICTRTGPDGRYRLDRLLAAAYWVSASAPGYQPTAAGGARIVDSGQASTGADLVLLAGGRLVHGFVRDLDRRPVRGAEVQIVSWKGDWSVAWTGSDGAFSAWGPSGEILAHAVADDEHTTADSPPLAAGAPIELELAPASTVIGQVVERGSGRPVAGARVGTDDHWAQSVGPRAAASAITDNRGWFRIAQLAPGRIRLRAQSAHGRGEHHRSLLIGLDQIRSDVVIELEPMSVIARAIHVAGLDRSEYPYDLLAYGRPVLPEIREHGPPAFLRGRVVDGAGAPVAGAYVSALVDDRIGLRGESAPESPRLVRPVVTDERGEFFFGGLWSSRYNLSAYRRGGGETLEEWVVPARATAVTLTIPEPGLLRGTVATRGRIPEEFSVDIRERKYGYGWCDTFRGTKGSWTMEGVVPGTYDVAVHSADGDGGVSALRVAGGQQIEALALEVGGATLVGRVVAFGTGAPMLGVEVTADSNEPHLSWCSSMCGGCRGPYAITDIDGRFRIDDLAPGRTQITASWPGPSRTRAMHFVDLAPRTATDVGAIQLPRRRGVMGRVIVRPAADLGFIGSPEDGRVRVWDVSPAGPAAAAGLLRDDWIVRIDGNDVRGINVFRYGELIDIVPGDRIVLGLERGASVEIVAAQPRDE